MKPFELEDTFLLSKILEDLDVEVDLNAFMDLFVKMNNDKDKSVDDKAAFMAGQFFYLIAKRWHRGRKSIPEFVASMSEKSVEEVKKMKTQEMKDFFVELFKQEDIQDFFKSASEE